MEAHRSVEKREKDPDHPCGRREHCNLFDEELIEKIAEKAAQRAIERMTTSLYQEVGKNVINKAMYIIGLSVAALWAYLQVKGGTK